MRGYHGTSRPIKRFLPARGDHPSKVGVWFTDSADVAELFAQQASRRWADGECSVVEVDARVENPRVYQTYSDFLADWREYGSAQKLRRALVRAGNDGVVIKKSTTDFDVRRIDFAVFDAKDVRVVGTKPCRAGERKLGAARRRKR
jgi:ADP-Ribosyltransferase in polyvalent proteins